MSGRMIEDMEAENKAMRKEIQTMNRTIRRLKRSLSRWQKRWSIIYNYVRTSYKKRAEWIADSTDDEESQERWRKGMAALSSLMHFMLNVEQKHDPGYLEKYEEYIYDADHHPQNSFVYFNDDGSCRVTQNQFVCFFDDEKEMELWKGFLTSTECAEQLKLYKHRQSREHKYGDKFIDVSRQMRFRAWDKMDHVMLKDVQRLQGFSLMLCDSRYDVMPMIENQYDLELYKNDIIYDPWNNDEATVIWDKEEACYKLQWRCGDDKLSIIDVFDIGKDTTVIGNIYEGVERNLPEDEEE